MFRLVVLAFAFLASFSSFATSQEVTSDTCIVHQVQAKETLFSISRKYSVTVAQIKELNNMTANALSIGQKLVIKACDQKKGNLDNLYHKVQPKETLYSIAKKYHTTVDEIVKLNKLNGNVLSVGMDLVVGKQIKTTQLGYPSGILLTENAVARAIQDNSITHAKSTCYHPSLPVGTIVKITNAKTGKMVLSRVSGKSEDKLILDQKTFDSIKEASEEENVEVSISFVL